MSMSENALLIMLFSKCVWYILHINEDPENAKMPVYSIVLALILRELYFIQFILLKRFQHC